jgi:hypothetical protein
MFAEQATLGFLDGQLGNVALVNLVKVVDAILCILLGRLDNVYFVALAPT